MQVLHGDAGGDRWIHHVKNLIENRLGSAVWIFTNLNEFVENRTKKKRNLSRKEECEPESQAQESGDALVPVASSAVRQPRLCMSSNRKK